MHPIRIGAMFERVTITVPGDLRKRMQSTAESVNWSAVATKAFEEKLAEVVAKRETQSLDDAVQRMRASRLASADGAYADGFERGREFVTQHADWKFCEGLKGAMAEWTDARWAQAQQDGGAGAALELVLKRVDPQRFKAAKAVRGFLVDHVGDHLPSAVQFARGWCEGALSCFRQIEERVTPGVRSVSRRSYRV